MIVLYVFIGIVLAVFALLFLGYLFLVYKLKKFGFSSNSLSSLKKEIENLGNNEKQISGMTQVFLPQIMKDFKDFNINQLYLSVEKSIRTILNAIENKDLSIFQDKDFNLIENKLKLQLEDLINSDIIYTYDDIKFHKHAIKNYTKSKGIATIEICSSLEYYFSKTIDGNKVIKNDKKIQTRYITKFVYIVDSDAYKNDINVYGINCPNCGAVIESLNSKNCKYCKTRLNIQVVDLLKCWKLIDYKED